MFARSQCNRILRPKIETSLWLFLSTLLRSQRFAEFFVVHAVESRDEFFIFADHVTPPKYHGSILDGRFTIGCTGVFTIETAYVRSLFASQA